MKILAIRGEGLASLAGAFEIRLDAAPLRDAGVFAIVGPTGAGKSTLLDATCLALFDRTPRLPGRGARIGPEGDEREQIASGDPRNVLRKGASKGVAEVDFRGIDGRTYRARWEVRRARGKSDGRLQESAITLSELETERAIAGGKKTEVLAAIEERLGLSFAQFKRAVLLAQGQFAAFLEAGDRERAELLERMTGTEIYGRISIEVARRAREERAGEERVAARLATVELLAPEAREACEEALPQQRLEVHRATERARAMAEHALWWQQVDVLAREEEDARTELAELDAQLEISEARRREIEEAVRCEPLRAPVEAVDRAREDSEAIEARIAASRADRESAQRAELASIAAEQQAAAACERADRALAELAPRAQSARELDRSIAAARERCAGIATASRAAADELASRREIEAGLDARREALTRSRDRAAERRLELAAIDRAIAEDAGVLLERVDRLLALTAARADADRRREAADAGVAQRAEERATNAQELSTWREAVAAAERRVAERREALAREPAGEEVRAWAFAIASARDVLTSAVDTARRAREALERASARKLEGRRAEVRAEEAKARRAAADTSLSVLGPVLAEAERARELARATLDLAHLRAELRDGEACPLCGAVEHPFADHAPARLLEAQEERARELRDRIETAGRERAQADAELRVEERAAEAARIEAEQLRTDARGQARRASEALAHESFARLAEHWSAADATLRALVAPGAAQYALAWTAGESGELLEGAELVAGPARPAFLEPLPTRMPVTEPAGVARLIGLLEARGVSLEDARSRLARVGERRAQIEESLEVAQDEREQARAALAVIEERARAAESVLEAARARAAEHAREIARIESERSTALERLAPASAALAWAAGEGELDGALARGGAALRARLASGLEECVRARHEEQVAIASLAALSSSLAEARTAVERAREIAERVGGEERVAAGVLASLSEQRAAVLAGDPDEAERAARASRELARDALATAVAELGRARLALSTVVETCGALDGQHATASRGYGAALERLARMLERTGIDEPSARRALARPPEEIAAWRRDLAQLDTRRAARRAVLDERVRRRAAHAGEPPPDLPPRESIERELTRARDAEDRIRQLLAAAEERIARDDRLRAARREIEAELEAQRARVRTWAALEELIGSSDGKRFRVFAQGLTLDLLLEHANHQLGQLAPRYALRRAPGTELALQVIDREMGEEVRGIKSLSGGETFLVSLALALALASMTARRVRVDSLFIDEGFGGLDPESLEIVLAALDTLQATGRQVGIVSHVLAIAERFPARVEVRPRGNAESTVEVVS